MHDITPDAVVVGIDTHKDVHVVVAISGLGARLSSASFSEQAEAISNSQTGLATSVPYMPSASKALGHTVPVSVGR